MTAVYPDSMKVYAYLNSAWSDITADVIGSVTGYWGVRSNREVDRVADTGRTQMTLNNATGKYSPNLAGALSGWKKGVPIKLDIIFRGRSHVKFRGQVDSVRIIGGASGLKQVYVSVVDWMDYAAKYPLVNPGIQTNQRADQALQTIVDGMPIQPQATSFGHGDETFVNIFDSVTTRTKALTEFNKLALSEMGYIYLRKERINGEQLTFDARSHRKGTDTLTTYSVPSADAGYLLKEDGGYLLKEDGGKIIIERSEDLTLGVSNNMLDIGVEYGANVINRMTVVAYPRRTDTSLTVLFSLGYSQIIGSGETITLRGGYFDPTGGSIVNAISNTMVAPVITTDYLMNDNASGTGTDRSSLLTITADYGTEGVTYTLTNTHTATCYITRLQARGYGVYTYATLESTVEDQPSYDAYGYSSETLHQMYQQDTSLGKRISQSILENERQPRTILNKVSLSGNTSIDLLYGFLVYDVGDLVHIVEDQTGIDSYYYIQAVNFSVSPGGIVLYGWTLKETSNSLIADKTALVAVEFGAPSNNDYNYIKFDSMEYINNLYLKTISLWIKMPTFTGHGGGVFGLYGNALAAAWDITINGVGSNISPNWIEGDADWQWNSTGINFDNNYHHIVIARDASSLNIPPILYLDGVLKTLTIASPQTTTYVSNGKSMIMGVNMDGYIKDARIYSNIITAAQALSIYNSGPGGTGYLTDMVFQAAVVKSEDLTYFTDHTMLSTDRIADNVLNQIGTPYKTGSASYPIIRLP